VPEYRALWFRRFLLGLTLLSAVVAVGGCRTASPPNRPVKIVFIEDRVLTVGQVAQVLKRTDILQRRGVDYELVGVPMTRMQYRYLEDADVILNGQAASLRMIKNGFKGRLVGTMGSGGNLGVVVPPESPILGIGDLKGKKVLGMRNNALQMNLNSWLNNASGVVPRDVRILPYDKAQLNTEAVAARTDVDAILTWDPILSELIENHRFRQLQRGHFFTTILVSDRILDAQGGTPEAVLASLLDALGFMATHRELVDGWFAEAQGEDIKHIAAGMEWNHIYNSDSPLGIRTSVKHKPFWRSIEKTFRFLKKRNFLKDSDRIEDFVDLEVMNAAEERWRNEGFDPNAIQLLPVAR